MALDQSALTELLNALRAGGDLDFMRESWPSPSCAPAASCPAFSNHDAASTAPCGRWSWRRSCTACSTRKVDDLVAALGIDAGVSKSQVSHICGELDSVVAAFRERRLDHIEFPYVFLTPPTPKPTRAPTSSPRPLSWPPGWPSTATTGGCWASPWATVGPSVLDRLPALAAGPGSQRRAPGDLRRPRKYGNTPGRAPAAAARAPLDHVLRGPRCTNPVGCTTPPSPAPDDAHRVAHAAPSYTARPPAERGQRALLHARRRVPVRLGAPREPAGRGSGVGRAEPGAPLS